MALIPVFQSEIVEASYDEHYGWLYLDWKGVQHLTAVQQACRQLTDYLEATGCAKVLNDNTNVTQTSWELVAWVADSYLPLTTLLGLEYVAWVVSPQLDCRSNIDTLARAIRQKPQVAMFDTLAEACTWLSSVQVHAKL
ncbi:hypothetical protein [Hymenobacter elongatus]|uniref:STAS/SEC14 domain-containing protein n=1 Tax=Hymenobacter elongatus TaxID=877208 RepID=A0A4Z0PEJ3_9BACT|nr:hypothetical protein [Hymenobacter elongatus]TGE12617.1 hypothetical protein E5J99_20095 [Hymenobacter elongatus]